MKKIFYILSALAVIFLGGCTVVTQTTSNNQQTSDPTFSVLNDYGQWIDAPGLGTVWRPYDENNWQPYYNGQWIWTDQGWMWQSDEPYGWVVYHYGNWDYTDSYGWVWLPNYVWAPARVRWYHQNGYVGWAPMPPPGSSTATIIYENQYVNRTWVFVPERNFYDKQVGHYRTRDLSPDIRILRSGDGERGPQLRNIENAAHRRIEPVKPVREEMKAGNRHLVRYRVPDNNSKQGENVRNNTGREEPVQTKPPAVIDRRPEPTNPTRNEKHDIPPTKPAEPQKPDTKDRGRNSDNLRNNNGRNVNDTRNEQNNSNRDRNQNIKPPTRTVEPQKPAPQKTEPQRPVQRKKVNDTVKSKNNNGRDVNNPRPEPKNNETKTVEKKRPEPKKAVKEVKKKEEKMIKKEKAVKDKIKNDTNKREQEIK
jgi:Family of unknown function (DUF6600)